VRARGVHRADRGGGGGIRAHIGLRRDVAEPVIGHIDRRRARPRRDGIGRHPVQGIVEEGLRQPLPGVRARGQVGQRVELTIRLLF